LRDNCARSACGAPQRLPNLLQEVNVKFLRRRFFVFAVPLLWLAFPNQLLQPPVSAAPAPAGRFRSAIDAGREAIEGLMRSPQGPPGLGVAVLVDGRIAWSEGFGFADLEQRVPVWPHTKMRIGSISKSLTSAALGLLHEQGKLDLDAPVQKYVPSFPAKQYPITPRQLSGHLAGIRHYDGHVEEETYNTRHFDTVLDGLALFANDPLLFKPGERYHYSSHGWNLLSAVIEGASGQQYLGYMQQQVFDPLGMRHTAADLNSEIIPNRARFYVRDGQGRWINTRYVDNSYKWAGGGFLSTPEDLVRFGWSVIVDGQLLRPETVKLLTTSQHTNDGKETGYGMGWAVSTGSQGRREIGHGGGSVGGASRLTVFPDQRVVIAMIINTESIPDAAAFAARIAEGFMVKE
jgi:CubicO group peptidase (beta-lactamase class C family)